MLTAELEMIEISEGVVRQAIAYDIFLNSKDCLQYTFHKLLSRNEIFDSPIATAKTTRQSAYHTTVHIERKGWSLTV